MSDMPQAHTVSLLKSFVAGGVGGIFYILIGHPLDTVKVRLQTTPRIHHETTPLYKGAVDCLRKIITKDGISGLYRGMGFPIVAATPICALTFFGYNWGTKLFANDPTHLRNNEVLLAGMFSGAVTTSIIVPGDRVKCLLQVQSISPLERRYRGPTDVVRQLYQEGGVRSLFRGTAATLLRDVPASGAYFLSYELTKNALQSFSGSSEDLSVGRIILAGGVAGVFDWIVAFPPDALKSRYQTAPEGKYPNGIRSVFSEMMAKEGFLALYRGITPVLLRAFPASAACFLGYEATLKFLDYMVPDW